MILGDNGFISYSAGIIQLIQTTSPEIGGDDHITTLGGDDIVLGGNGSLDDIISAGDGFNIVLGDHGKITYLNGSIDFIAQPSHSREKLGITCWISEEIERR
jgi:hypothetical protein